MFPFRPFEEVALDASIGLTESASVGESPPAAWALAVTPSQDRRERTRLRQPHDRPEGQRCAVAVVAICSPADRMAQDFDPRLWDVLVIVRCARLPQVLQFPRSLLAGFDVQPRPSGHTAPGSERSGAPHTQGRRGVVARILQQEASEVGVHHAVHRPGQVQIGITLARVAANFGVRNRRAQIASVWRTSSCTFLGDTGFLARSVDASAR
jgi:hypothetical protein